MSTLTCSADEVYVSVTKKCTTWAREESYKILSGSTVLVTSAAFANNEQRTDEYCLTASSNNQYTFKMIDTYGMSGDSWFAGSWVSVAGLYGNVVFKNFMVEKVEEEYALSLFYPVKKNQEWKMYSSSDIPANWYDVSFAETGWSDVTLGNNATAASGTQYFRKHFDGIPNMAAYEVELNYRYGIVVYMNGVEVFRDHMAEGEVTPTTPSNGAFEAYEYHGVIRPAGEIEGAENVLAVELHFPANATESVIEDESESGSESGSESENESGSESGSETDTIIAFDAYVASIASSTPITENTKCYIYPYAVTLSSQTGSSASLMFNWGKQDYFTASSYSLPATVSYELGGPRAHINGIRVWPYTYYSQAPGSFTLSGAMSSSTTFTDVLSVTGATYRSNEYKTFNGYFNAKPFQSYRLTMSAAASASTIYATEVQPVVCSLLTPTSITFNPSSYSVFAGYGEVTIAPELKEFTACSVSPSLPAGLTLDATTCTVSGKPSVALASTVFTMTSAMGTSTIQGTFTLEATECAGTLTTILRTYKSSSIYETFSIKDMTTQQVVLSVAYNSGQPSYQDWTSLLCLSSAKYEIDVGCSNNYWQEQSRLWVNAMLDGDEYETIARIRYDANLGLESDRVIYAQWSVAPKSQWFYKMGEVPANWFGSETSAWNTGAMGAFPASSNQIQLYKQTFNVASLTDVIGFVISLRYLYGCVIYVNGHEAFRNGVTGDLSASSVSLNAYTDLMYHQISLPARTMESANSATVNYLVEGANTIAIAVVAQQASQTSSVFDCAVRLMGGSSDSRVFDYTISHSSFGGYPNDIANMHYANYMSGSTCSSNYWTIAFNRDRREWISSVTVYLHYQQDTTQPRQFALKARNTNLEEWTLLKNVTAMTWSLKGEHKTVWLENSKPYNQYRFENFGTGDASSCSWKLSALDLSADLIPASVPALAYTTPLVITRDIEMGEVYPNSEYYYDFTVSPALPEGLSIDHNTGKISGTCTTLVAAAAYTITAKKFGGGEGTSVVTLSVEPCNGEKHLITLVARLDTWAYEGSYKLFSGKDTSGQPVSSNTGFKVANGLNYADFCVPNSIYTLALYDSRSDGWVNPAGYYLTIDVGEMVFEMGQMPTSTRSVSTMFSSLLPFQIEYDDWKLWNSGEAVATDWKSVNYDEAGWATKKAAELGNHMSTTAYVRHEVSIPSLEDYHVLNVRVKYTGGVVAYFNGRLVARFNLEDGFDALSEATAVHDASLFSKFHVVLPTAGAVTGKNVIAFEIHRASGQSAIVFDATGVFGVNECSIVVDSFSSVESSTVSGCTKEDLLDLNPTTYGNIPNAAGSFLSWVVENLEGSKFNSFALQTNTATSGYSFSVYGRWESNEEYTSALTAVNQQTKNRVRSAWAMPVGIAGFSQFKFEVDGTASGTVSTNAYVMQYCKASGAGSCPGVDEYPAVGEGEISPAKCAEGFRGYSYRECTNGVLGDVQNDKCEYKLPDQIEYQRINMEFVMGTEVSSGAPTYKNIIQEFFMQDSTPLPDGLKIDATTGEISGIPVATMGAREFTVRGKNPAGETFAQITITVVKGYCLPEGVFERTPVGEVAEYKCALQGSYVGSQKRACVLGKKNGEWQKASGFCMPVFAIVVIVIVVIIVIAVVVFMLMRSRKTKAVGGVKGKGAKVSSKKAVAKKASAKAVKV